MVSTSNPKGLQHAALFYDSDQAFAASAIPFVGEGVERGDVVLINAAGQPVVDDLRVAFAGESQVHYDDSTGYTSPVSVIDQVQRTMDKGLASGVPGFRAMRFIDLDTGPTRWLEWLRFEAVVNRVFARYPFQTLCPYDTRVVEAARVTAMRRAHPVVFGPSGAAQNNEYVDPHELVLRPEYALRTEPLQLAPPLLVLDDVGDLRNLRIDLYPVMLATELSRRKSDDFVKAVGEVVLNARRHGRGTVDLRLWSEKATTICTVSDQGDGIDDPFMGYARPAAGSATGETADRLGLWAARQLCDSLDYAWTDEGFIVRLTVFG